jgi:hypothetical protein
VSASDTGFPCSEDVEPVEQDVFFANLDYYLNAAEAGQKFWLVRDGKAACRLEPARH